MKQVDLSPSDISAIIEMALSDVVEFSAIRGQFGLSEDQVRELMRRHLKPGSYKAWRIRVHRMRTLRSQYK